MRRRGLLAGLAALAAGPAAAQDASPRVVATFPAAGAAVAPGELELSVTFDQPMMANSFSYVVVRGEPFPRIVGRPALSEDRRTYSVRVEVLPGVAYAVQFNSLVAQNFKSASGAPAVMHVLRFSALTGAPAPGRA